jgi:hypothetical protein
MAMCDYCHCRDLEPIGRLSEDHETIGALETAVRSALGADDFVQAHEHFAQLAVVLDDHLTREETGLFAELRRDPSFDKVLDGLETEHTQMRAALAALGPAGPDWADAARQILADLDRHIWAEEYDLFPASIVGVTDDGWDWLAEHDHAA